MHELVRSIVSSPLWPVQLVTGAKSFEENPILGSRTLNRWGLHGARVEVAYRLASARREGLARALSPEARAAFDRDGFLVTEDFLPRAEFEALRSEVAAYRGPILEKREGRSSLRKVPLASRADEFPSLRSLRADPRFRAAIDYAGGRSAEPALFLQSVFQDLAESEIDPQTVLHADTFHPTVKAWYFLTDVAPDAGAFTYVPGSHRLTPERLAWERRMSVDARTSSDASIREGSFRIDEATLRELGLPAPRPVAVPANTLVVADTFGFHARGVSARPSLRVEVWAIGRRNPFLPFTSLDRLVGWLGGVRRGPDHWQTRTGTSMFDAPGAA